MTPDQATWEDKLFIKSTSPDFYHHTIRTCWPHGTSCGQEVAQGGGGCQAPDKAGSAPDNLAE
jgi:hypothetical protein